MKFRHRRSHEVEEGESYYISMTDMMVGVVFIFIIMLSYFALQFHAATSALTQTTPTTTTAAAQAEAGQADLIASVGADLMAEQLNPVQNKGGLTFTGDELFEAGSATLSAQGEDIVMKVGKSLTERLPCFSNGVKTPAGCPAGMGRLQAVSVGAHAAVDPSTAEGRAAADLTLERSSAFYTALLRAAPELSRMRSAQGGGLLVRVSSSVAQTSGPPSPTTIAIQFSMAH